MSSAKKRRLVPPPELQHDILVYCGGAALAKFACTSRQNKIAADEAAGNSLTKLTTLSLDHAAVSGNWYNRCHLLSAFTDTPGVLEMWTHETPLAYHAVPRAGLLRSVKSERTDYRRPDHRAYALKIALKYGDAAIIEGVLGRMTKEERLMNRLPNKDSLPMDIRKHYDRWFTSYTTTDDIANYWAHPWLRSRHFRPYPRSKPIPVHKAGTISETWRDVADRAVRQISLSRRPRGDLDPEADVECWMDGTQLILHFIRLEAAGKPLAFPGISQPPLLRIMLHHSLRHLAYNRSVRILQNLDPSLTVEELDPDALDDVGHSYLEGAIDDDESEEGN